MKHRGQKFKWTGKAFFSNILVNIRKEYENNKIVKALEVITHQNMFFQIKRSNHVIIVWFFKINLHNSFKNIYDRKDI